MNLRTQIHNEKVRRGLASSNAGVANAAALGVLIRGAGALYKSAKSLKSVAIRAKAARAAAVAYRGASAALAKIAKLIKSAGPKNKGLAKKLGPQKAKLAKIKRLQYRRVHSLIDKKKNPAEYAKVRRMMGVRKTGKTGVKLPPPVPKSAVPPPVPKSAVPPPVPKPDEASKIKTGRSKSARVIDTVKRIKNLPGAGMVGDIATEMVVDKAIDKAFTTVKKAKKEEPKDTVESKTKLTTYIKSKTTKLLNSLDSEITKQKAKNTRLGKQLLALETQCRKLQQKANPKSTATLVELRQKMYALSNKKATEAAVLKRLMLKHSQLIKQAELHQQAV